MCIGVTVSKPSFGNQVFLILAVHAVMTTAPLGHVCVEERVVSLLLAFQRVLSVVRTSFVDALYLKSVGDSRAEVAFSHATCVISLYRSTKLKVGNC